MISSESRKRLSYVFIYSIAMAFFEAAVVVYLRHLFYPEGFSFPLRPIDKSLIVIELARELSTITMLLAVSFLAGEKPWERFAYFAFAFGIWDIFYYVWLKVAINWPSSIFDWDILFLIPIPWIGPVIAPVLISVLLIVSGILILARVDAGYTFAPKRLAWVMSIAATAIILYSFMSDVKATLHFQMPNPYQYWLLLLGLALYVIAMISSLVEKTIRF